MSTLRTCAIYPSMRLAPQTSDHTVSSTWTGRSYPCSARNLCVGDGAAPGKSPLSRPCGSADSRTGVFPLVSRLPRSHHVPVRPCVFCGNTAARPTDEHVIPRWARDGFNIQDWTTITTRDSPGSTPHQVRLIRHLNIVLRDRLCPRCNSEWLGGLERAVQSILEPMVLLSQPRVTLGPAAQKLLALWAVKTCLLFELAIRQNPHDRRTVKGYRATPQELAWLWAHNEPPPRSLVWVGAWDCQREVPVNYEPSSAPLPTADGTSLAGHLTTFTLGFVAFQVFTVDFLAAEQHGAVVWNTHVPDSLAQALYRIWPQQPATRDISWPPPAFRRDDWRRLITWDGKLRPDEPVLNK